MHMLAGAPGGGERGSLHGRPVLYLVRATLPPFLSLPTLACLPSGRERRDERRGREGEEDEEWAGAGTYGARGDTQDLGSVGGRDDKNCVCGAGVSPTLIMEGTRKKMQQLPLCLIRLP